MKRIIDFISDLNGICPMLKGGDLLIISGKITSKNTQLEYDNFYEWLDSLPYSYKIVVGCDYDDNINPDMINCNRNCYYFNNSTKKYFRIEL